MLSMFDHHTQQSLVCSGHVEVVRIGFRRTTDRCITGLYTDDSPGLKVDPVIVLVLSLVFIFSVVALHSKWPESSKIVIRVTDLFP